MPDLAALKTSDSDLCLKNPGMDVDLYLAATLRDMVYIRRGDLSLTAAIDTERLEVVGSRKLRSALRSWLNLSPLSRVRSQRDVAV